MTLPEGHEKCRKDIDSSPESTPAKKIKLEEKVIIKAKSYHQKGVSLLDLSDDVLLIICYYLRPTDLLALSLCCTRLEEVVSDRTLWVHVDFRPTPLEEDELNKYLKFFLPSTKSIATYGFKNENVRSETPNDGWIIYTRHAEELTPISVPENGVISLTSNFIQHLCEAAPNLKEFIAENQYIDGSELPLDHFPPTLEHLSFKNSEIFSISIRKSYFSGFDKVLPNVECLNLSNCYWFTCHSFLALSKSKTLKKLILYGCVQIDDCVPYVSLGFRFGFSALTVLDLRKTMISDRELGCLNSNITLRELYLEAPPEVLGGERKVTDMGITMFGNVMDLAQNRANFPSVVVLFMIGHVDKKLGTPSPLRKLIVRNYSLVSDTSLKHAAVCLTNLTYIDVTGTGCSQEGVVTFKTKRPNVTIISNYDTISK